MQLFKKKAKNDDKRKKKKDRRKPLSEKQFRKLVEEGKVTENDRRSWSERRKK
jgi:hypothetical protein